MQTKKNVEFVYLQNTSCQTLFGILAAIGLYKKSIRSEFAWLCDLITSAMWQPRSTWAEIGIHRIFF